MKLPKIRRLMGLLARHMQRSQVKELLAALPTNFISQKEREDCESAIRFFVLLRKRTATNQAFLDKLESLLSDCQCEDFLETIRKFKIDNPDFLTESTFDTNLPNGTRAGFKPKPGQSETFRRVLLSISRTISNKQLEIMVALPATPEAEKQNIHVGHQLFDHMERHGCISENDTEMLEEMIELFPLKDAIDHLSGYHKMYPPIYHEPEPSAPLYASPAASLHYSHNSQPQSLQQSLHSGFDHHPGPHSFYGTPVGFSRQHTSSSSYSHSFGGGESFSAPSSGGSGFSRTSSQASREAHSAPLHHPQVESGEANQGPNNLRVVVPSESPSAQRKALQGAVKTFPNETSAPAPPSSSPSLSAGGNGTFPRPLLEKRPHQEAAPFQGGSQSHVYPRPLHEQEKKYPYPSSGVLFGREHKQVAVHPPDQVGSEAGGLMPPPSTALRSPGGDGGVFSRLRNNRNQAEGGGEGEGAAAIQGEIANTMSTISSYTGDSDKFNSAESAMSTANHYAAGHGGEHPSLESLESYRAEHSFPSSGQGGANLGQFQQQPLPSAPPPPQFQPLLISAASSYSAESLNIPEAQQAGPSLPPSSSVSGHPPASSSSTPPHGVGGASRYSGPTHAHHHHQRQSTGSQEISQGDQFRHAPVHAAPHRDDLAYPHQPGADPQLFIQQTSQPVPGAEQLHMPLAPAVGEPLPFLSNYTGPQSGSFAQTPVSEQGSRRGRKSRAYSKPVVTLKKSHVFSKSEAKKASKADAFESINLDQYHQQLSSFKERHLPTDQHTQKTEHGRKIAQASSERNIEMRSLEEGQKESEGEQAASSENGSFQTGYTSIYPQLPSDTSSGQKSSTSATLAGTKRARGNAEELESSEVGEEKGEESGAVKRPKTSQRVTRSSKKKPGIFSRVVGFFIGSKETSTTETESSSEEQVEVKTENTESESEFHDAQEY